MKPSSKRTFIQSAFALAALAALPLAALAQDAARPAGPEAVTLPCCHCLGEVKTADLNTGRAPWTVNGAPAVVVNPTNAGWSQLPPAKWIAPNAAGDAPPGDSVYELRLAIGRCTIASGPITVAGQLYADNGATITVSGASGSFTTPNYPYGFTGAATAFSFNVSSGGVVVIKVVVKNQSGPSGLLVKATATRRCVGENGATPGGAIDPPIDRKE